MPGSVIRLHVDHAERQSVLFDAVQRSGAFDVRVLRLVTGDYLIAHEVLIERKTIADFAISLVDGRLFPQVARLARSRYRSVLLIEGPQPAAMPDVHPHALDGALISLAAMWRLPVLHSRDPDPFTAHPSIPGRSSQPATRSGPAPLRPEAETSRVAAALRAAGPAGRRSRDRPPTAAPVRLSRRCDSRRRGCPDGRPRPGAARSGADS